MQLTTALKLTNVLLQIPIGRDQIIHEVELGVVIGKTGRNISQSEAMDHVGGYALTLDMTDIDLIFNKVREFKLYFCDTVFQETNIRKILCTSQ